MKGVQASIRVCALLDLELQGHSPNQSRAYARGYELAMKAGNKELAKDLALEAHKWARIAELIAK